jgi:hypothetical protein
MLGAIVILSVAGSLYQNIGAEKIGRILPDATRDEILQLTSGMYSPISQNLTVEVREQVVQEVTLAIRNGFLMIVVGSALAFVSSLFLSVSISTVYLQSPHTGHLLTVFQRRKLY